MNKELEHKIYKLAYEIHLEDVKECTGSFAFQLDGMCAILRSVISKLELKYTITSLTEFVKLKPKNKTFEMYWWSRKATNRTRIKKFKHLLKVTE